MRADPSAYSQSTIDVGGGSWAIAPSPVDEAQRLAALRAYDILDTPPEAAYDRIVRLAAQATQTPIALISLIDENRQWFKARLGLEVCETERKLAFCAHTILQSDVMVVTDASQDPRFAGHPLVMGVPSIRFYGGAPLRAPNGHVVGTLCVLDTVPRLRVDDSLKETLQDLAGMVVHELEARLTARRQAAQREVEQARYERLVNIESQLRVIVDHAPLAVAVFDHDVRYLAASQIWKDIHLAGETNLVGRSFYQLSPGIADRVKDLHHKCLSGETVTWDAQGDARDSGATGRVRWKMYPWYAASGDVGGIVMLAEPLAAGASVSG